VYGGAGCTGRKVGPQVATCITPPYPGEIRSHFSCNVPILTPEPPVVAGSWLYPTVLREEGSNKTECAQPSIIGYLDPSTGKDVTFKVTDDNKEAAFNAFTRGDHSSVSSLGHHARL